MNTASTNTTITQPVQAVKTSTYQSKRTTYTIESIFTNQVKLADALYRIALAKIKFA